jgi:flagellar hook-basal body complex protein FliE
MSALAALMPLDFIAQGASLQAIAYAPDDEVGPLTAPPTPAAEGANASSFADVLGAQLQQLDSSIKAGEQQALRLASGQAESLHRVMIDLEQARLSLQLALQVRNRVIEAVQDLQRWQL